MLNKSDPFAQRDQILLLALGGQSPRMLALKFGVTEWTIKRWVGLARRRQQLPYWRNIEGASSADFRRDMSVHEDSLSGLQGAVRSDSTSYTAALD